VNGNRAIATWMVELAAGGAAALLLVLFSGLLRLEPWLAVGIAALRYGSARIGQPRVWPGPMAEEAEQASEEETELDACRSKVAQLRQFAFQLDEPHQREARQRIAALHELASDILTAIEDDPSKHALVPSFLADYLVPIHALARQYVHVAGLGLKSARETLSHSENETLPKAEQSLREFYERLHAEDVVELAVANEMLDRAP
jgi:hypothetical protein